MKRFVVYAVLLLLVVACGGGSDDPDPPANQAPEASFTASPLEGEAPLEVSFDASGSSDSDGTVDGFMWDFGDGSTGEGDTASHTFDAAGEYTITLTVTDNQAATATATETITVNAAVSSEPPVINGIYASQLTGFSPLRVEFDVDVSDADTDVDDLDFSWTFSNGDTSDFQNTIRTIREPGVVTATLKVTDPQGNSVTSEPIELTALSHSDYFNADVRIFANKRFYIEVTKPANFPEPEKQLLELYSCESGQLEFASDIVTDEGREFRQFLQDNAGIGQRNGVFILQDVQITCANGEVQVTLPQFDLIYDLLATNRGDAWVVTEGNEFTFPVVFGFDLPTIEEWYYETGLKLAVKRGLVSAREYRIAREGADTRFLNDDVTAIRQGGDFEPVLFESERTPVTFDPTQPITVVMDNGRSRAVEVFEINYDAGTFVWYRTEDSPLE